MADPIVAEATDQSFESQFAGSPVWFLRSNPNEEGSVVFSETARVWVGWQADDAGADVWIKHARGGTTMVVAPPSNYDVAERDELFWKLRSPSVHFRLGWGYVQDGATAA